MACYTVKAETTANIRQKVIFLEMEDSKAPVVSYKDVSLMAQLASYTVYENGNDSAPIGSLLIST